jgi:hypothetical protein
MDPPQMIARRDMPILPLLFIYRYINNIQKESPDAESRCSPLVPVACGRGRGGREEWPCPVGERLPFHTHVLNYFWVATSAGRARSRRLDGGVTEKDYVVGETQHMQFARGESMTHDLENIGDTVLTFTTVEDKRSPNAPLPL